MFYPVSMAVERLDDLPSYPLPSGYSVRFYEPGDEEVWRKIQSAADRLNTITGTLFDEQFGGDAARLASRQCYLLAEGAGAIGTATAWYDRRHHGRAYGRIHWVALLPDWQGRGLSKPLLSVVCRRLHSLGHRRAYLTTSTGRPRALNLYLGFGFCPEIRGPSDIEAWKSIESELKWPKGAGLR